MMFQRFIYVLQYTATPFLLNSTNHFKREHFLYNLISTKKFTKLFNLKVVLAVSLCVVNMLDGMSLVKEQNTLKENNFIKPMTMNNEYMSKY